MTHESIIRDDNGISLILLLPLSLGELVVPRREDSSDEACRQTKAIVWAPQSAPELLVGEPVDGIIIWLVNFVARSLFSSPAKERLDCQGDGFICAQSQ